MRFCQPHWDALRAAIEARGLSALVAESGEKAMSNIARELETGEQTLDTFDPLMNAHWQLVANLGKAGGGGVVSMLALEGCPLCFANEQHKAHCDKPACTFSYDAWTGFAADEQVKVWQSLGGGT